MAWFTCLYVYVPVCYGVYGGIEVVKLLAHLIPLLFIFKPNSKWINGKPITEIEKEMKNQQKIEHERKRKHPLEEIDKFKGIFQRN